MTWRNKSIEELKQELATESKMISQLDQQIAAAKQEIEENVKRIKSLGGSVWTIWKWAKKPGRGKNMPKHLAFAWQRAGVYVKRTVAESAAVKLPNNHVAITDDGHPPAWTPDQPHQHKVDGICKEIAQS